MCNISPLTEKHHNENPIFTTIYHISFHASFLILTVLAITMPILHTRLDIHLAGVGMGGLLFALIRRMSLLRPFSA